MKNLSRTVFLISLLSLSTCKQNEFANFVSFQLDGVTWSSTSVLTESGDVTGAFSLVIDAVNANQRMIIRIFSTTQSGVGTYLINNANQHNLIYAADGNISGAQVYEALNCSNTANTQILITQFEPDFVSGSFSGKICLPSGAEKIITNGSFTLSTPN
jgi:hypothetical protein